MNRIEWIKGVIKRLYETDPNIHVNVRITHPKVIVDGAPVKIIGVYRNIFQIEEYSSGRPIQHTFQYGDVLTGHIVIAELDPAPR